MKKLISYVLRFSFMVAFLCICGLLFSQITPNDITVPTVITNWLVAFYNAHPWVAYVVIAYGLLSEVLGGVPSVKANSVYQLITGWLKGLIKTLEGLIPFLKL